jgi:hypothetical protein
VTTFGFAANQDHEKLLCHIYIYQTNLENINKTAVAYSVEF